jgi:hypothetical protein
MADAMQIWRRIISLIGSNGPSLPVQIARDTGLSILFASAFLSELFNEKEIHMSHMRVGSSPLYYLTGQEMQLEKFSQYLKNKEKDAFALLKEKKILKDSEQHPAIRVALREIKDFAIPFEKNGEGFWRYFLAEESEKTEEVTVEVVEIKEEPLIEIQAIEEEKVEEKIKEIPKKEKTPKKIKRESKPKKQSKPDKKDENFFNKIKEFLEKKKIEILDIVNFKNDEAILKVKNKGEEEMLFVFNQKKITEKEVLKAYKKASEKDMKYSILSLGETPKKLDELISAMKTLSDIGKIE